MKILLYSFFLIFCCQIINSYTDTNGTWKCGVSKEPEPYFKEASRLATVNVVVVFFDFPDGRLSDGSIATQDWQLESSFIPNLDAVFNFGYNSYDGINFIKKARKLTYDKFWDIYFSENTYITDEAHPDWMSHGRFGLPPNGDPARAWGSFKDYYNEVSYGNLIIEPYQTHTRYSGIYNYGIVNQIDEDANGNAYVRPIKMKYEKLSHYQLPNTDALTEQSKMSDLMFDAIARLQEAYNEDEIDFEPTRYNGKILMVFAGGTDWIGGLAGDFCAIYREKFIPNRFSSDNDPVLKYSVINGIGIACHEFGHLLGWSHTHNGNYDVMNGIGKVIQNCPPHPNIVYKLQAGWISSERIRKIRTANQELNLPPVELNGDCAVITIYGKPGYDNNWTHSEFFIIENRRMYERSDLTVKFDKKLVWQPAIPPVPPGFNGGVLITHYSPYNNFIAPTNNEPVKHKFINAADNRSWDMLYDQGNARDFFGVLVPGDPPTIFDALNTSRSNSSFDLKTGIVISSISGKLDKSINFQSNYVIEEPPDYNAIFYSGMSLPDPLDIEGTVFYTLPSVFNRIINIKAGAVLDFVNGTIISGPNSNILAEGTQENSITFRGCGFGPYRLTFRGIVVANRPSTGQTPYSKIIHCNFNNLTDSMGIIAGTSIQSREIPYIIENNFFDNPSAKIKIIASNSNLILQNVEGNNSDIVLQINSGYTITVHDKIEVLPGKTLSFIPTFSNTVLQFSDNAMIDIKGDIIAQRSNSSEKIVFEKSTNASRWAGMDINGGACNLKYCDIKNSTHAVTIYNPSKNITIENCNFEDNLVNDISVSDFSTEITLPHLIQNNTFQGFINKPASITCSSGNNIDILANIFNNTWNYGICLYYITNSRINENQTYAETNQAANPVAGIICYSSAGEISCNYITNFINGIYLDNSSSVIYNNEITGNATGLYLINGSSPKLAPVLSEGRLLYEGGHNQIYNNVNSEIKCSNPSGLPLSLPVLIDGYNSIYDEGIDDCLIDFDIAVPAEYNIRNNYWGTNGPAGRICPSEQNVIYAPFLNTVPPLLPCTNSSKKETAKENKPYINDELPNAFKLHQNYPNPFNPVSAIKFDLPKEAKVLIKIYDLLGREVITLVNEIKQPGNYETYFDGTNLSSGMYFYRIECLQTGTSKVIYVEVKKMILIK